MSALNHRVGLSVAVRILQQCTYTFKIDIRLKFLSRTQRKVKNPNPPFPTGGDSDQGVRTSSRSVQEAVGILERERGDAGAAAAEGVRAGRAQDAHGAAAAALQPQPAHQAVLAGQ